MCEGQGNGWHLAATTEWFAKSNILPTVSFGVFDHLDDAGRSLRQQYSDRLQIGSACDLAGFHAYHVAELWRAGRPVTGLEARQSPE